MKIIKYCNVLVHTVVNIKNETYKIKNETHKIENEIYKFLEIILQIIINNQCIGPINNSSKIFKDF